TNDLAYFPDGKTIAVRDLNAIRFWDVATGKERTTPEGHYGPVECLAFTGDGKTLISGCLFDRLRLWDTGTGKPMPRPNMPYSGRQFVASADGKVVVSGGMTGNLLFTDTASGRVRYEFRNRKFANGMGVHIPIALSADGKTLATVGHSTSPSHG